MLYSFSFHRLYSVVVVVVVVVVAEVVAVVVAVVVVVLILVVVVVVVAVVVAACAAVSWTQLSAQASSVFLRGIPQQANHWLSSIKNYYVFVSSGKTCTIEDS